MISQQLITAYKNAKYIVTIRSKPYRIVVDEPCPIVDDVLEEFGGKHAYFITPENPFSISLSNEENKLRHERFIKIIIDSNCIFYEGYGTNEDETWPREKSYLIICDDDERMQRLAGDFGQNGMLKLTVQSSTQLLTLEPLTYRTITS